MPRKNFIIVICWAPLNIRGSIIAYLGKHFGTVDFIEYLSLCAGRPKHAINWLLVAISCLFWSNDTSASLLSISSYIKWFEIYLLLTIVEFTRGIQRQQTELMSDLFIHRFLLKTYLICLFFLWMEHRIFFTLWRIVCWAFILVVDLCKR